MRMKVHSQCQVLDIHVINPRRVCAGGLWYLLCVYVCMCEESIAWEQRLYNKMSIATAT